jgi:hypothetical protein
MSYASTDARRVSQDDGRERRRQGALLFAVFALIWAAAGASGIADEATAMAIGVVALGVTAVAVLLAIRSGSRPVAGPQQSLPEDWRRRFLLVNVVQWVAIGLAIAVLVALDRGSLIPAVICLIVGAHFFPLARTFRQSQFGWTGAAFCVVGAVGLALIPAVGGETARTLVGLGAAVTLWVASLYTSLVR